MASEVSTPQGADFAKAMQTLLDVPADESAVLAELASVSTHLSVYGETVV